MNNSARALIALLLAGALSVRVQAVEAKATPTGISIDAGAAGTYVMSYPRLLTPMDKALNPEQIVVKPDGSGATMSYTPSGKLTLDRQPDGSWLYHITEIPSDRVKFTIGFKFPLTLGESGATWSFDGTPSALFPKEKGKLTLYQGNPQSFIFKNQQTGFSLTYPQKTWTQLTDQRSWGRDFIGYGQIYYFPGKKSIPEISYTFKVGEMSDVPSTTQPVQK